LVETSNVAGLKRCDFRSDDLPEERLPPRIQDELLRFAQEAISNAVRRQAYSGQRDASLGIA
jgi:signal transduction histidine kinase